jgi:hypothetical protein
MAQIHTSLFRKKKDSILPDFCNRFQQVVRNIGPLFIKKNLSYQVYNQIWLNIWLDDGQFGYITKFKKQNKTLAK